MRLLLSLAALIWLTISVLAQQDESCPSDSAEYLVPRLTIGELGRVLPDIQVNLRPQPGLSQARIGMLPGRTIIEVLAGPACADGYRWWEVQAGTQRGWIAEGSLRDSYFVEPRGTWSTVETYAGIKIRYVTTPSGFEEPEGCQIPPDDYSLEQLEYATLNQRTLFMLDQAQHIYQSLGGERVSFRWFVVQGSYNAGGVAASFGTHDGGGAVDIRVLDTDTWTVLEDEIPSMLVALRIAGFAAWLRDYDELYPGSPIHIHAIAIGDQQASEIAQWQVAGEYGYLRGYSGLPETQGYTPTPDRLGTPIICEWIADWIESQTD